MDRRKINPDCNHCWHAHRGPIWMVIPDGHVLQDCCKCSATRMVHVDHAYGWRPRSLNIGRWLSSGAE